MLKENFRVSKSRNQLQTCDDRKLQTGCRYGNMWSETMEIHGNLGNALKISSIPTFVVFSANSLPFVGFDILLNTFPFLAFNNWHINDWNAFFSSTQIYVICRWLCSFGTSNMDRADSNKQAWERTLRSKFTLGLKYRTGDSGVSPKGWLNRLSTYISMIKGWYFWMNWTIFSLNCYLKISHWPAQYC